MEKTKESLADLKKGQTATIHSFADDELSIKLLEMGCLPGEKVTVSMVAPFGDPIAIEVLDYVLSLRKSEAKAVIISRE